ncbi:hypothetical protein MAR_019845 [Mya arenaria]|uniref:Uncharacterized protein n=1 Tax=Mya arenaria TaxID=6604 RepID=A0ABY7E698_MYAAR|nr:hypothetical protein MAR_019845 [Mya arenaria]
MITLSGLSGLDPALWKVMGRVIVLVTGSLETDDGETKLVADTMLVLSGNVTISGWQLPVLVSWAELILDLNEDEQPAEAQSSMPVNQRQKRPRLTKKRHIKDSEDEQPAEAQSSMPVNQRPKRPRLSKKRHIQESDSEDM